MAPKKPQKELQQIAPKNTDTVQNVPQTDASTLRLIWNLCHLCNVTTSSISVWLSLEALARETSTNGSLHGSYIAYPPAMRAHAMMLSDVCRNLETDRDALLQSNIHFHYHRHASYRSLVEAANSIPRIIRMIPQSFSPFMDAAALDEASMPGGAIRQQIRNAYDHIMELCVGNPSKGIVGWKVCWETINQSAN